MFEPPPIDVQQELAALRAEVAEVRRMQDEGWMDEVRAQEVRAIVTDVLADSSTRTNEVGPIWRSPYGGGQRIMSGDGNWTFLTAVTEQVKFVYANAYGGDSDPTDQQTAWGMEQRRLNLIMSGTAIDPSVSYLFMIQYDSQPDRWADNPNTFSPVYAWVQKDFGDGWTVMVGNQNIPWDLQTSFLEGCSLTVGDYSIFNYRFGAGKQSGAAVSWNGDWFRAAGGVFNQINSAQPGWNSQGNLSFAVAGRAEVKWGIPWEQISRTSGAAGDLPGLVLGLGLCMSNGRAENPQPPDAPLATPSAQGVTADARVLLGETVLIASANHSPALR